MTHKSTPPTPHEQSPQRLLPCSPDLVCAFWWSPWWQEFSSLSPFSLSCPPPESCSHSSSSESLGSTVRRVLGKYQMSGTWVPFLSHLCDHSRLTDLCPAALLPQGPTEWGRSLYVGVLKISPQAETQARVVPSCLTAHVLLCLHPSLSSADRATNPTTSKRFWKSRLVFPACFLLSCCQEDKGHAYVPVTHGQPLMNACRMHVECVTAYISACLPGFQNSQPGTLLLLFTFFITVMTTNKVIALTLC